MNPDTSNRKPSTLSDLMRNVRASLGRAVTPVEAPPAPEIDEALVRLVPADENCLELFASRAAEAGMQVQLTTLRKLRTTVQTLLGATGTSTVSVSIDDPKIAEHVNEAVVAAEATTVEDQDALYDTDIGITDVDAAIAETGTLIIGSCAQRRRNTHLIPPVHIAVVRKNRIVADMIDYWALIRQEDGIQMPAASVLVTGPSKTADIEGILVTGVHGPGTVHVVIVT
jgi:L-lactate dehydrogenase complex protein LldG